MCKLSWSNFITRHSVRHLVIASLPVDRVDIGTMLARNLQTSLSQLIGRLGLSGAYALAIVRSEGNTEILVGFESRAAADRLSAVVHARKTGRYPEWATRKLFALDDKASDVIAACSG